MRFSYIRRESNSMFSARTKIAYTRNLTLAKRLWFGQINREQQVSLKSLSANFGLSIAAGDLQLLENRWYVTHSGLIRLAQRRGCSGIAVSLITEFCEWSSSRFVCKATVYKKTVLRALSVTAMLPPPTFPRWSMGLRCGSPKLAR